ncbi:hypothetical protein OS493_018349 [Desmophyllum pertusum]|uniref:Uncharacterized protein n=1 Tax=Desmophyllum pertusum TaxID=174260 RepID=A0A9W9YC20_9CNID|nr:hypothetical protein OS493_018349 [Desmophyllum pertusum]
MNYREIFQSLGASNRKSVQENNIHVTMSKTVISIEEINDDDLSGEETTACIVEEEEDTHPHPQGRPVSRSGRVSIMSMTPAGRFEANTDALCWRMFSPVSANSPASEQTTTLVQGLLLEGRILVWVTTRARNRRNFKTQLAGRQEGSGLLNRHHVGLSEFFPCWCSRQLSFGESVSSKGWRRIGPGIGETRQAETRVFYHNMCGNLRKASLLVTIVTLKRNMERIMVARKKAYQMRAVIAADSRSSTLVASAANDAQFVHDNQIHDFGIVDFLKAQPVHVQGL